MARGLTITCFGILQACPKPEFIALFGRARSGSIKGAARWTIVFRRLMLFAYPRCRLASRPPQASRRALGRSDCVTLFCSTIQICWSINKPPGMAVHGGSGVRLGLIESLRVMHPQARYLELVHRLDRDTSGLVLIAKNARVLRELHAQLRANQVNKVYWACTVGKWPAHQKAFPHLLQRRTRRPGSEW